jgi:hypothetical protein
VPVRGAEVGAMARRVRPEMEADLLEADEDHGARS